MVWGAGTPVAQPHEKQAGSTLRSRQTCGHHVAPRPQPARDVTVSSEQEQAGTTRETWRVDTVGCHTAAWRLEALPLAAAQRSQVLWCRTRDARAEATSGICRPTVCGCLGVMGHSGRRPRDSAQVCEFTESCGTAHFKRMSFMV